MKAIVIFKNGKRTLAKVNKSYSRGGVHYYNLTLNAGDWLNWVAGNTDTFVGEDIEELTYVMS